jgi:ABC-type dipeptide/oligopeptide/nickel transport system permease component
MLAYALRRLLWIPLILAATFAVAFALVRSQPGGPFDARAPAAAVCDVRAAFAPQLAGALATWARLDVDVCTGRARDGTPVLTLLAAAMRHTLRLSALALSLALVAGIGLGVLLARVGGRAGTRAGGRAERAATAAIAVGEAIPGYASAVFLLLLLALALRWVVPAHPEGLALLLPAAALASSFAASHARAVRAGLSSPQNAAARRARLARGVSSAAAWATSVRLAVLPVLAGLGATSSALVMAGIGVEVVFGVPGLGALFIDAAHRGDSNVLLGGALAFAFLLLASNFLLDLVYASLDPRVRSQR